MERKLSKFSNCTHSSPDVDGDGVRIAVDRKRECLKDSESARPVFTEMLERFPDRKSVV